MSWSVWRKRRLPITSVVYQKKRSRNSTMRLPLRWISSDSHPSSAARSGWEIPPVGRNDTAPRLGRDADGLADRSPVLDCVQHVVRDVGSRDDEVAAQVLAER